MYDSQHKMCLLAGEKVVTKLRKDWPQPPMPFSYHSADNDAIQDHASAEDSCGVRAFLWDEASKGGFDKEPRVKEYKRTCSQNKVKCSRRVTEVTEGESLRERLSSFLFKYL